MPGRKEELQAVLRASDRQHEEKIRRLELEKKLLLEALNNCAIQALNTTAARNISAIVADAMNQIDAGGKR